MATNITLSLNDYLHDFSHCPDVEYIDGTLKQRPVVPSAHGRLQALLSLWFGRHEQWCVDVAIGVRT